MAAAEGAVVGRLRAAQQASPIEPELDRRAPMEALYGTVLHRWLRRTAPL